MADEKRYYWLKLKDDFFAQKEIKKLRKIAGGDTYTIIYLKLQLLSLKNNGTLLFENIEDTFCEELSLEIDEDPENIKFTLMFLQKYGLLEEVSNTEFLLPKTIESIGSEGQCAERVRKHREKKKTLLCNTSVTAIVTCNGEKEIETEQEIKIDKDIIPYQEIMDLFNQTCYSLPTIREINQSRKKTIKARWESLKNVDEFYSFFKQVENSDWLSGRNEKGWKASFDWIMKPANFTKIIEGNFINKNGIRPVRQQSKREESLEEFGRMCDEFDRRRSEATSRYDYRSIPGRV